MIYVTGVLLRIEVKVCFFNFGLTESRIGRIDRSCSIEPHDARMNTLSFGEIVDDRVSRRNGLLLGYSSSTASHTL